MVGKEVGITPESGLPQEIPRSPEEIQELLFKIESAVDKLEPVIDEIYDGPGGLASGEGRGTEGYGTKVVSAQSLMGRRRNLRIMGDMCQWFMGGKDLPVDPLETDSFIEKQKTVIQEAIKKDQFSH